MHNNMGRTSMGSGHAHQKLSPLSSPPPSILSALKLHVRLCSPLLLLLTLSAQIPVAKHTCALELFKKEEFTFALVINLEHVCRMPKYELVFSTVALSFS